MIGDIVRIEVSRHARLLSRATCLRAHLSWGATVCAGLAVAALPPLHHTLRHSPSAAVARCRPLSKRKAWKLSDIVRKESVYDPAAAAAASEQRLQERAQAALARSRRRRLRGMRRRMACG